MLRLSKKAEYAFMAAIYLAMHSGDQYPTAKEIADNYNIPFQLVAKILQNLAKNNIAISFQGVKGGYKLNRLPEEISLIEIIKAVEKNYKLTECMQEGEDAESCTLADCCKIRDPLVEIQRKIDDMFRHTSLKQIL